MISQIEKEDFVKEASIKLMCVAAYILENKNIPMDEKAVSKKVLDMSLALFEEYQNRI